jgi:hypothetical protein
MSDLFKLIPELQKFLVIFIGEVEVDAAFPCFEFRFWALEKIFRDRIHIGVKRKERCPFSVAHGDIIDG